MHLFFFLFFFGAAFCRAGLGADEAAGSAGAMGAAGTTNAAGDTRSGDSAKEESNGSDLQSLRIRIETSPSSPVVGNPWIVSILVDHPVVREVTVNPPRFPAALVLERVRTEIRNIPQEGCWTRVEFLFTPQRPETVTLGPFEALAPNRQGSTGETMVRIREATGTARRYAPRFRWVTPSSPAIAGKMVQLSLELSDWEPFLDAPAGFFGGRLPLNAILEESPPLNTGEGQYAYSIGIMPLEESDVRIEGFSFQAGPYALEVPGISMEVLPVANTPFAQAPGAAPEQPYLVPEEIPALPFPEIEEKVFPLLKGEYGRSAARARAIWENQSRVEALADIRKNERDSLAGPFLAPLRKEMERSLGLGFTDDEKWRPLGVSLLLWAIICMLLFSAALVLVFFRSGRRIRKKSVTSRRRGGFKTIIMLVIFSALALVFLDESLGNILMSRLSTAGNQAVLERAPAYRVPDTKGAVNLWFPEGQPVITGDYGQDWCYVETSDGRSGWVKREAVFSY